MGNSLKTLCNNADSVHKFHEILLNVSVQIGLNMSLYEIPTFLNHVQYSEKPIDFVQNYPCYSMCKDFNNFGFGYGNYFLSKWKTFTKYGKPYPLNDFTFPGMVKYME